MQPLLEEFDSRVVKVVIRCNTSQAEWLECAVVFFYSDAVGGLECGERSFDNS